MKILFPTDFSDHANQALEYAVELSNRMEAQLLILHSFVVHSAATTFVSMEEMYKKRAEEEMEKLVSGITPLIKTDLMPVTTIIEGTAASTILRFAKAKKVDLIVMGTQGMNSILRLFLGSVTKRVCARSTIPVLAIPENVGGVLDHSKIVIAIDNKDLTHQPGFDLVKKMAQYEGANVDVLHVINPGKQSDETYDPFIKEFLGDVFNKVIVLEGKDSIATIKQYVELHDVGMLVMIRRYHSFLDRILLKGHTGEELILTSKALLILPE